MNEPAFRVSPRQAEILTLVAQGKSDKEIALALRLSLATVRTHLHRLYVDNRVSGRTQAVAAFLSARLRDIAE